MQNPFIKLPNDFSNLIFHIWFLNLFEKQPGLWKEVMNCKCVCPWKLPHILNLALLLWHGANNACTEWCCQQPSAGGDCTAAELCKQGGSGRNIPCKGISGSVSVGWGNLRDTWFLASVSLAASTHSLVFSGRIFNCLFFRRWVCKCLMFKVKYLLNNAFHYDSSKKPLLFFLCHEMIQWCQSAPVTHSRHVCPQAFSATMEEQRNKV